MATGKFERHLSKRSANYQPLTPLTFLPRAAHIYPDKIAIVDGERRIDYRSFYARSRRLASALAARDIGPGDTVAMIAPNTPELLEAHFGVPMCGAVLNALNTRLDAATIAYILDHGEARLLIADQQYRNVVEEALSRLHRPPPTLMIRDRSRPNAGQLGQRDYDAVLNEGDPNFEWHVPDDEWQAITLNYTSGTTGDPKGVVCHHRGAHLAALGNSLQFRITDDSVYLWTLPMFHCNGWTFPWAVTAAGGTHVCLRKVEPAQIFSAIAQHGVTHLCGAPIILNMLVHAPRELKTEFPHTVEVATGGAAPPSTVISKMEAMGFHVTHLYGLTESFGPATICTWQSAWDGLEIDDRARMTARQGVPYPAIVNLGVMDAQSMQAVPQDGETIGEVMLRGHSIMKGYLKNPQATEKALADGWFRTGDLAVMHADGYMEIKDRAKDIIISGGENISSLEVEEILYQHPSILEAAVVARPDEFWGETPCAFVTLSDQDQGTTSDEIISFCRAHMAHFKVPKTVVFSELPKTSTGKVQKSLLRERARNLE